MSMIIRGFWVLVWVVWAGVGVAGQAADLGETAFQQGRFEEAAAYWEKVLSNPSPGITPTDMIEITVRLAGAYQELGKLQMARYLLTQPTLCEQIEGLKNFDSQNEAKAKILNQLSEVYFALPATAKNDQIDKDSTLPACLSSTDGKDSIHVLQKFCNKQPDSNGPKTDDDKALDYAYRALSVVPFSNAWLKAKFFNSIGNILATRKDDCKALSAYWKSAELADKSGDDGLSTKAWLNFLQLQIARQREGRNESFSCNGVENCPFDGKLQQPRSILPLVEKLPDSHDKTFALISLANLEKELANLNKTLVCQQEDTRQFRQGVLENAKKIAEAQHDKNALGYVRLYLAELETEKCSCEGETKNCYSNPIKSIEETIKYQAQSYPLLQKFSTTGTEQFWIRQADSFVSSRFNWPLSPNVTPEQREKCKDECESYSSPCVQDKLSDDCKEVCRSGPTLFLRDYHPELSFRLEWQLGKILFKRDGPRQVAVDAYERATKHLEWVEQTYSYANSSQFYAEKMKFYLDRSDVLLQSARLAGKDQYYDVEQNRLKTAIDSIELFNETKLQDYFHDECVTRKTPPADEKKVQQLPDGVAIFYIFLFDDRVELLLNLQGHLQLLPRGDSREDFTREKVKKQAKLFSTRIVEPNLDRIEILNGVCDEKGRMVLEKCIEGKSAEVNGGKNIDYLSPAKYLYSAFFTSAVTDALKRGRIDTLVIVPADNSLLTIPFAALYDSDDQKYLIENYALVIAYSSKVRLKTVTYQQLTKQNRALVSGLTTKLPEVEVQLGGISEVLLTDTLRGIEFTVSEVNDRLKKKQSPSYSVIHFATHGHFQENSPDHIYLEAYNEEKLTIDQLENFIGEATRLNSPVELLTLSACQSAAGDDKKVLGLTGVAVKVGSRSALGTLWLVPVLPTNVLIKEFYLQLPHQSIAKALQHAQRSLIDSMREENWSPQNHSDPYRWAAFLLVGGS